MSNTDPNYNVMPRHKNCKARVKERRETVLVRLQNKSNKTALDERIIEVLEQRIKDNSPKTVISKQSNKSKNKDVVEQIKDYRWDGMQIEVYSLTQSGNRKKDRYRKSKGKKVRLKVQKKYTKSLVKSYDPYSYSIADVRKQYPSEGRVKYVVKLGKK